MQLFQYSLEFFGDRKTEMCGIFQKAHALIGKVKANHGTAQRRAGSNDMQIRSVY